MSEAMHSAIHRVLSERGVELVRFETPDLNGVSRGKSVAADRFWDYVDRGLALVSDLYCWDHECWVATGTGFGEDLTFADLTMRPDLRTFALLPHRPGEARVICDMTYADGRPVEAAPRRVLQRQVETLERRGLRALMQAEYEFYLVDAGTFEPPFGGTDITTTLTNQRLPVLKQLMRDLRALGCTPNTLNQEWGPSQYELNFEPVWGLDAGDHNFTYKTYAKEIASDHGLVLTFMTKPFTNRSACSSHLHVSLFDGDRNLFADPDDERGVSPALRWAIGGILEHAPALRAVWGPTVNCDKRYRKGTYAPASATWGFENRSVAVRVKAWRGERTHIENRIGSGSSNPYLAFAGMLAAMTDGIERKIEPPEPVAVNAYHLDDLPVLPPTLEASLEALEADEVVRSAFGEEFVRAFLGLKRHEIAKAKAAVPEYGSDSWQDRVTEWERNQFLLLA